MQNKKAKKLIKNKAITRKKCKIMTSKMQKNYKRQSHYKGRDDNHKDTQDDHKKKMQNYKEMSKKSPVVLYLAEKKEVQHNYCRQGSHFMLFCLCEKTSSCLCAGFYCLIIHQCSHTNSLY